MPAERLFSEGCILVRILTTPRLLLAEIAVMFAIVGTATFRYPPDYVNYAAVWSVFALVASASCLCALWRPTRWWLSASGTAVIFVSLVRGLDFAAEIIWSNPHGPRLATFQIAAVTWTGLASLFYALWTRIIVPWTAAGRPTDEQRV